MIMIYRLEVLHLLGESRISLFVSLSRHPFDRYCLVKLLAVALLHTASTAGLSNKIHVS